MPDETEQPIALPARQRKVLEFIRKRCREQHTAPTLGEIRDYLGHASHTGAVQITKALIIAGMLEQPWDKGKARNFRLTDKGRALLTNG